MDCRLPNRRLVWRIRSTVVFVWDSHRRENASGNLKQESILNIRERVIGIEYVCCSHSAVISVVDGAMVNDRIGFAFF